MALEAIKLINYLYCSFLAFKISIFYNFVSLKRSWKLFQDCLVLRRRIDRSVNYLRKFTFDTLRGIGLRLGWIMLRKSGGFSPIVKSGTSIFKLFINELNRCRCWIHPDLVLECHKFRLQLYLSSFISNKI